METVRAHRATLPTLRRTEPIVVLWLAAPSGVLLPVAFLVDTGSPVSLLTVNTGGAIGIRYDEPANEPRASLDTVGSMKIEYRRALLHIGFDTDDGHRSFVSVIGGVAKTSRNVLGRDFLCHFGVTWETGGIHISTSEENS